METRQANDALDDGAGLNCRKVGGLLIEVRVVTGGENKD